MYRFAHGRVTRGSYRSGLRIATAALCSMALMLSSYAYETQEADADQGIDGDPRQRAIAPGEYVLIYRDAAFYEVPGERERRHRSYEKDRSWASQPFERRVLAKAVADHGDWVEIERVPGRNPLVCESVGFNQRADVTLRFFVSRDDLALAVRHRTSRKFDDGTKVELLPGVAVESTPDGEPRYRAWHRGIDFAADISPKDVGLGFSPEEAWKRASSGRRVELDDRATVGDASLVTRRRKHLAEKVDSQPGRTLIRIQHDCARLTVWVPDDAFKEQRWMVGRSVNSAQNSCPSPPFRNKLVAQRGTPVYWPEGGEAGRVTRKVKMAVEGELDDVDLCRRWTLPGRKTSDNTRALEEARQVEYCFEREDLEYVE